MASSPTPVFWTTRDRQKVRITEMEDTHLINAIEHVKHVRSRVDAYADAFAAEVKRRGLSEYGAGVAATLAASARRRTWDFARHRKPRVRG